MLLFSVLTFGFEPVVYDVSESVGSVDLGVVFISGNAGVFVPHVNVSTEDGTASSKICINIVLSMCNDTTMIVMYKTLICRQWW